MGTVEVTAARRAQIRHRAQAVRRQDCGQFERPLLFQSLFWQNATIETPIFEQNGQLGRTRNHCRIESAWRQRRYAVAGFSAIRHDCHATALQTMFQCSAVLSCLEHRANLREFIRQFRTILHATRLHRTSFIATCKQPSPNPGTPGLTSPRLGRGEIGACPLFLAIRIFGDSHRTNYGFSN